jgi:D-alanine-D-alanine ligase
LETRHAGDSFVRPRVAVLHGALSPNAAADEIDLLEELDLVCGALHELGYESERVPLDLDLNATLARLRACRPAFVFNLVESVDGKGQLLVLGPSLLDHAHLPYTGAPTAALFTTTNKLVAKKMMRGVRIATPAWVTLEDLDRSGPAFDPPYIVKPIWEDASVGIDESSVVYDPTTLQDEIEKRGIELGTPCFAEAYVHGREFNVAMVAGARKPTVLPPAEMVFSGFEEGRPKVMGYRAKWDENADVYHTTCRSFDVAEGDAALLRRIRRTVLRCWDLFDLRGWARVDLRVDDAGREWVLEVNANPCISPGAGFLAAAAQVGLTPTAAVARIVADLNVPPPACTVAAPSSSISQEAHEPASDIS